MSFPLTSTQSFAFEWDRLDQKRCDTALRTSICEHGLRHCALHIFVGHALARIDGHSRPKETRRHVHKRT